jgi:hypothetical protein
MTEDIKIVIERILGKYYWFHNNEETRNIIKGDINLYLSRRNINGFKITDVLPNKEEIGIIYQLND